MRNLKEERLIKYNLKYSKYSEKEVFKMYYMRSEQMIIDAAVQNVLARFKVEDKIKNKYKKKQQRRAELFRKKGIN